MFATSRFRRSVVPIIAITIAVAVPAAAQNNARVFGVITDAAGQPVEGVTVTLDYEGGLARSYEVTTNAEGEFLQMGLVRGPYTLTAVKEGVGINRAAIDLTAGQQLEHDLTLRTLEEVYRESISEEERAALDARAATTDAFDQGLAAFRGGDLQGAVALFRTALETTPDCAECQRNLGLVLGQLEAYDEAEAALRAALALDPTTPNPTKAWPRSTTRSGGSTTRPRPAPRRRGSRAEAAAGATTPPRCSTRASSSGTRDASTTPGSSSSARSSSTPITARPTTGSAWPA